MIEPMDHQPLSWSRINWKGGTLPFVAVHLGCLAAFWLPFSGGLVALAAALYVIRMFGITAGYHRYFSHRSFKTSRVFQAALAVLGLAALQKGPLWWAAHHRHHHRHSDRHGDLHSPGLQGFLWAHFGWILVPDHERTEHAAVADLARYPELVWLDRHHRLPGIALAVALVALGGWPALVWGFCISTVAVWHATFCINSLTHMFGRRRFLTRDDSRNSLLLAVLTLGEGWHNNHHYYKASTRQGFYWWEVDLSYYALRALAAVGVVWDLKQPPRRLLEDRRVDEASGLRDPLVKGVPAARTAAGGAGQEEAAA